MYLRSSGFLSTVLTLFFYPELLVQTLRGGVHAATQEFRIKIAAERSAIRSNLTPSRASPTFEFKGVCYEYLDHDYNCTRISERCVEIPIGISEMANHQGERVIEVGNVLHHYGQRGHTVIDKFETGVNVLNLDILDGPLPGGFDFAITISTLEHLGWDYPPLDKHAFFRAIYRILDSLREGGCLFGTVPLGHNPYVDRILLNPRALPWMQRWFLSRTDGANDWVETPSADAALPYVHFIRPFARNWVSGPPYPYANAICVFRIQKSRTDQGASHNDASGR